MVKIEHHSGSVAGGGVYELVDEGEIFGMVVDRQIVDELKDEGLRIVEVNLGALALQDVQPSQSE